MERKQILKNKYYMLIELKKVLGINKTEESSFSTILSFVKNSNENEIFLLKYVIELVISMPKPILNEYRKLNKYLVNPQKYHKHIAKIEHLYKTNKIFIKFKKHVYKQTEWHKLRERYYFNALIYEIAKDFLSPNINISLKSVINNIHFLIKWLEININNRILNLEYEENTIIKYILQGYLRHEIVSLIKPDTDTHPNLVDKCIDKIIPTKFCVNNFTQALTLYYYNDMKKVFINK